MIRYCVVIIVNYLLYIEKESTSTGGTQNLAWNSSLFSEELQKIIDDTCSIKEEIARFQETSKLEEYKPRELSTVNRLLRRPPTIKEAVVVFEDELNQMMDKLTTNDSSLHVIPITGMGGIGKTTFAKNVYTNPFIVQHFDIRGWVTISQEYDVRELLLSLLHEIRDRTNKIELEIAEYHQLGEKFYKYLTGRRYLIIMDDIWSIDVWENLIKFLPDNSNGSRVMVTTRLSSVANYFDSSYVYTMSLLDENRSWNLFCRKVFVEESCPPELKEISKQIVKNCKGLPLSISVVGGLLASSKRTRETWEHIANDTNTIVNMDDDARCLKILSMSYNHLPVYLKPCFLSFGVFLEDHEIFVSKLIKLWVAEGFIRPSTSESFEEVAESCLKDLIDRNLVLVSKWGSTGNVKYCKIHDLVRDLCLREAIKERFLCVPMAGNPNSSHDLNSQRRIVIHQYEHKFDEEYHLQVAQTLQSASLLRSLTCYYKLVQWRSGRNSVDLRPLFNFKLLRILSVGDEYHVENVSELVNSRYVSLEINRSINTVPSSIHLLWNLQTIIVDRRVSYKICLPPEIWKMRQLRHLKIDAFIEPPNPRCVHSGCALENLQTLSQLLDLTWSEEVFRKIPNIKKLKLNYLDFNTLDYRFDDIGLLQKLQSLSWCFTIKSLIQNLELPLSLKKLTLSNVDIDWEGITTKVGSLPNLEKLRLVHCPAGEEWNPVEGQFLRLKYLHVIDADDLIYWSADEAHFPCLEHLVLDELTRLEEIPSGIGDIPTLRAIRLDWCNSLVVASAKRILEEQREFGNENLQLSISGILEEDEDNDEEEEEEEVIR